MRVEGNRPVRVGTARRDEKGGTQGASFAEVLGGEPAAPAAKAAPASPLAGLFALQEVPDPVTGKRRALQRAGKILDRLRDVQQGLLEGRIDRAGLADLAQQARAARETVEDPQLQSLLDDIELRAQVELAKLEAL